MVMQTMRELQESITPVLVLATIDNRFTAATFARHHEYFVFFTVALTTSTAYK
jgi:hypothetical protein